MQIRTWLKFSFFSFLIFVSSGSCFSQVTNVDLLSVDSLLTKDLENLTLDVNGEICSMVVMNTELEGLKFYSNMGVEKIMKIENGYKIWIPNQTNLIKFIIPGFPLVEYNLPRSNFRYSVYILSLKAEISEKIVVKDTLRPSLSIATFPKKAKVILNGRNIGTSPITITNPDFIEFEYSIYKKGYSLYSSKDSMNYKIKNISVKLADLFRDKRYFLTLNMKVDAFSKSPKQIDDRGFMPGICFGVFGKTGFYSSINYIFINNDLPTPAVYDNYTRYNKVRKLNAAIGINQQLLKSIFFYGGTGYTKRIYQEASEPTFSSESIAINTGLIFRIGWNYLLQIDYSKSITDSYSSIGFGLGCNFKKTTKVMLSKKVL